MYKILNYHSISDDHLDLPSHTGLSVERFRSHMQFLNRSNFTVISLSEMVDKMSKNKALRNYVSITFDDGYFNNLINALPILYEYGFSATIFIITSKIGESIFLGDEKLKILSTEDIKHIDDTDIFSIGSHSHNHKYLPNMSKGDIKDEVTLSRNILEDITGNCVRYLSYPFGGVDQRVSRLARQVGYSEGFSVWTEAERPFARLRIPIATADSWWRLWLKMSSLYFPLKALRSRLTV